MRELIDIYSRPQTGGELPYFVGKQYGSGWFKNLGRFAFPILQRIGKAFGSTAKDVLMDNKPILASLGKNAMAEVNNSLPSIVSGLSRAVPSLVSTIGNKINPVSSEINETSINETLKRPSTSSSKKRINKRRKRTIFNS